MTEQLIPPFAIAIITLAVMEVWLYILIAYLINKNDGDR